MDRRFHLFTRIWAVLAAALIAATWKLWTPQSSFPQIPFFEFLIDAPGWLDWIALALAGLSLLVCILGTGIKPAKERISDSQGRQQPKRFDWFRLGHLVFAIAMALLISFDQNRLQPWAYHFLILGLLIAFSNSERAVTLIRWIAISIYVYSAISKFDYQFVHTVGDQMLSTIVGFAGIETTDWPSAIKRGLVILLPVGELLVGIGLALARFRRVAAVAAIGLHLTLLLTLGPWGLDHRPGVLIWNVFFVLQAAILFWPVEQSHLDQSKFSETPTENGSQDPCPDQTTKHNPLALLLAIFVIWFPMTQWIGVCDHWPAWQVYSPSSSRAQLHNQRWTVQDSSATRSISQWSLEELGVPIYPQARFQLAVAIAVIEKAVLTNPRKSPQGHQIELGHQSHRISGERETEVLTGSDQFKMRTSRFWLNTRARKLWFD